MVAVVIVALFLALMWFLFFYVTGTPRDRRVMRVTVLFGSIIVTVLSTLLFLTGYLHR